MNETNVHSDQFDINIVYYIYSSFSGLQFLWTWNEFYGTDFSGSTRCKQIGRSVPMARFRLHSQYGFKVENGRRQAVGNTSVGTGAREG